MRFLITTLFLASTIATATTQLVPHPGTIKTGSGGGGSGANTTLSNLADPATPNQNFVFNTGSDALIKTKDGTPSTSAFNMIIQGGSEVSTGFSPGDAYLKGGNGYDFAGTAWVQGGTTTGPTGAGGDVILQSGLGPTRHGHVVIDADTNYVNVKSNVNLSHGPSAPDNEVYLSAGEPGSDALNLTVRATSASGDGLQGNVTVISAGVNGGGNTSGSTTISTGNGGSGASSGNLILATHAADQNTGDIIVNLGTAGSGTRGKLKITDGSEGTAGDVWTATDSSGHGHWATPSGGGGGTVLLDDGNSSAPSLAFAADTDTGFWRGGSGTIIATANGTNVFAVVSSDIEPTGAGINIGSAGSHWSTGYINSLITSAFGLDRILTTGGTTGDQTIDKMAGTVNFAAAASSLIVTDANAVSTSIIFVTAQAADSTCRSFSVTRASGSFTITANAACTAETAVGFLVTN